LDYIGLYSIRSDIIGVDENKLEKIRSRAGHAVSQK